MTDKTRLQTYNFLLENKSIEDILNQPNATFKNKNGNDKQRHGGLTIKFSNDIDVKDKPSKVVVNDKLKNNIISDINEVSVTEILTKEIGTQTETIEEKSTDNFSKYTYNSVTILEDKKIMEVRKTIFNFKKNLELIEKIERNLKEDLSTIRNNLFELELIELKLLRDDFNWLQKKEKNKQILNDDDLKKLFFLKEKIEEKEEKISKFKKLKKQTIKNIDNNNTKIKELNYKINQLNQKLDKYIDELSIPATPPALWIKKSDELLKLEKQYLKTVGQQNKEKILKKISVLNKKIKKIWNDKKIEKIYEEILPINNEIYFIKTFVHFDSSISEQVMFFHNFNNNMKILIQTKNYQSINEYKNDFVLCEEILINKNNNKYQLKENNIKNFLKQHDDFKLKPTKKEIGIWIISWLIIPLGVVAINLIHPPLLIMSLVIGGIAIVLRGVAELFSPKSKKVWSWISNKICKNEELKEKNKKERQSISKNLKSDKLEMKLETQFKILKQELDNNKDKKVNDLINNETLNHNPNNISENLNIESENNQNFDSFIRNTVNHQDPQPSTSTIYHSNSML